MKVLVVGDIHGNWGRLNALLAAKRPDVVLQCGDFGWWPRMEVVKPVLYDHQKTWTHKGVKTSGAKIYFCDGNHEDHEHIEQNGEIVEQYDGVFHAQRGSVLVLEDGRNILFAGGARSVDAKERTIGHDWFPEETISNADFERMMCHKSIDIVVSHTCPTSFASHLQSKHLEKVNDPSCVALEQVLRKYNPSNWYFGHWHMSKRGSDICCDWQCLDYPGHGGMWWCWA